jgi:anaerobic ribonucleoside-triphosphate reductase activating protein
MLPENGAGYGKPGQINVAGLHPGASCLGPGKRFLLWVQGCLNHCPGCITPKMQPLEDRTWMSVGNLAQYITKLTGVEGITVIGGEPFLQAESVAELLFILREKGFSSMVYTGYTLADIRDQGDESMQKLISCTDILVDGPYRKELDFSQKWRGSENQTIHFLTDKYRGWNWVINSRNRDVEVYIAEKGNFLVLGIPVAGLYEGLKQIL